MDNQIINYKTNHDTENTEFLNETNSNLGNKIKAKIKSYYIYFLIFYLFGVFLGSLFIKTNTKGHTLDIIQNTLDINITNRLNATFLDIFTTELFCDVFFITIIFLLGFFLYSLPFIFLIFLGRGLYSGIFTSYLIYKFGFMGLLYFFISSLIPMLIILGLMILQSKQALYFKEYNLKYNITKTNSNYKKLYLTRYFLILLFCCVNVILETLLTLVSKNIIT